MLIKLYQPFEHWHENGQIFLYSDPHFADDEMKDLRLNYICDADQVKNINKKVGKKDTIVFLGDIGDIEFIKQIRGYKVLIMGNHDKGKTNYTSVFDEVYDGVLTISDKIILSHEPVNIPFMYNIHGHVHGTCKDDLLHYNVCAEHIDYTPVSLKEIIKSGKLKDIETIHRITIDNATNNKHKRSSNDNCKINIENER